MSPTEYYVLICQTRYEEALKEFEICNSMKPEDTLLMCKLADTYRMLKRYDEAMEYAQTSVCLEPDSSDGWLSLAYIYEVQGNTAMQKDALERIVSLEHPVSHHKAIALAFLGNADDAINALESNNADFHEVEDVYHLWYMAYILVIAGRIDAASAALQKSFEVGMRNFKSIINQDVYQCMQQIPNLLDLISYWQEQANNEFKELNQSIYKQREDEITESVFTIPFTTINGEWRVRGEVNGLPLCFEFDTGASDVMISEVEADFMRKNGYLEERDFGGDRQFLTAIGELEEGTYVNIREMKLVQIVLKNVSASVAKNQKASLLLGKSVIDRFAKLEVDNDRMEIRFSLK